VLPAQIAVRNPTELGNNVPPFVGALAPGEFFHNPVQQNIWVRASITLILKVHVTQYNVEKRVLESASIVAYMCFLQYL
jgi:hypothetical protein